MVKIVGGEDLPDEDKVRLIKTATGKTERGARMVLARNQGRPAGDVTFGGKPLDLLRSEPIALVYVASSNTSTVRAIRSADNWSLWRKTFPVAPNSSPIVFSN
jgi:hypothetical protein